MQAVMSFSNKRFTIDKQADPVEFWSWVVNALHMDLTGGRRKKRSVVTDCFQGELEVVTEAGTGKAQVRVGGRRDGSGTGIIMCVMVVVGSCGRLALGDG